MFSLQDAGGFDVLVIVNNVTIHAQTLTGLRRIERKEVIFAIKRCQL